MTALVFLFAIAFIFGAVLALEADRGSPRSEHRPLGLIGWLTGGNWPAKVGGGLLVVGVGALLRYALLNFDVPPPLKLGAGIAISGALGLAAALVREGHGRRGVSLALGGAAFGVAYLTAYSAFALFNYLDGSTGIALLALTAIGAGLYAVTRSALSLSLLAMVGAFLAPAFAPTDPGPAVVYGYYAAASLLTLGMVAARGWRPLIHLSFLFTLGGGVFFAWTAKYFNAEHASVMQPALAVLAAIHVLMPAIERRGPQNVWVERLDVAYLLVLPAASAVAALLVAPDRINLSWELLALGAIWGVAAGGLAMARREGVVLHAVLALVMASMGVAARFRDLPWELILLAFSVTALWLAGRYSTSRRLHNTLAGLVPLVGILHVIGSHSPEPGSPIFVNGPFVERLLGAGLLVFAGHVCGRLRQSLDTLLWSVGVGWALIAVGSELIRWDLVSVALIVHLLFLVSAITLALLKRLPESVLKLQVFVVLGAGVTALMATQDAMPTLSWTLLFAAPLAIGALAFREPGEAHSAAGLLGALVAPIVATTWALRAGFLAHLDSPQFALTVAAAVLLVVLVAGALLPRRSTPWLSTVSEIGTFAFGIALFLTTVLMIVRSPWSIALELTCLAGLAGLAIAQGDRTEASGILGPLVALGLALVLQANLLRWLGPPGDLSFLDIPRMRLPTLSSLLWAVMGAGLTVWGRRQASRPPWVAGASLLVLAAVKLVLFDFGSLGQLTNILAVIAAGIVFLLVGWLAPLPPAAAPRGPAPAPAPAPTSSAFEPSPAPAARPAEDYFEHTARRHDQTGPVQSGPAHRTPLR